VREDAIDLYGFLTEEELVFFKQLLSVSGIGPKSALGVLNVADVSSLKHSIAAGDTSALTRVYGVGKKSAERIVVELRDKLAKETTMGGSVVGSAEVIDALMALGYRAEEVRHALKEAGVGGSVTDRIAGALKYLGSRQS
jgi:Holliday junction DNA helicase RuvA